jgi:hypothetical protein
MLAQKAMFAAEASAKLAYLLDKSFALLAVMVQMDLDIRNPLARESGNTFQQVAAVLLLRVEKSILGALACGIPGSILGDARPPFAPPRNPRKRQLR